MDHRRPDSLVFAACLAALAVLAFPGAARAELTVDEALERMNRQASTINDVRATAKVTKYDSIFEEKHRLRMELYYRKPDLSRVDTFRKRQGREVHTHQVIIGQDFLLRVWPENRHGELRRLDPEELKRRREDRNDPLTFFSRKPDDLKKDFNITMLESSTPGRVNLSLSPRSKEVPFDYETVELVVDTTTWMPAAIKAMSGTEEDDWSLYEFEKVRVNAGLKDSDFEPPADIRIEEVKEPERTRGEDIPQHGTPEDK